MTINASLSHPDGFWTTKTGRVELVGQWGHGHAARADYRSMPGMLIVDDGDDWTYAYRFRGKRADAVDAVALMFGKMDGRSIVTQSGNRLAVEPAPDDFWIEQPNGDIEPNLASYPDVVAY